MERWQRGQVLVHVPALLGDRAVRGDTVQQICHALESTVSSCESLSLDNESDRQVLISRLKRALGLDA